MNTIFLSELKKDTNVINLMGAKNIKASKKETAKGKNIKVEYFIGDFRVSTHLIGPRGALKVEVNSSYCGLLTYLHKA